MIKITIFAKKVFFLCDRLSILLKFGFEMCYILPEWWVKMKKKLKSIHSIQSTCAFFDACFAKPLFFLYLREKSLFQTGAQNRKTSLPGPIQSIIPITWLHAPDRWKPYGDNEPKQSDLTTPLGVHQGCQAKIRIFRPPSPVCPG